MTSPMMIEMTNLPKMSRKTLNATHHLRVTQKLFEPCKIDPNNGISPTAGGGGLGRLRSSPLSPSPSPQVQRGEAELDLGTWTWTRGTWAEVAWGAH